MNQAMLDKIGSVVRGLETIEDIAKVVLRDAGKDAYQAIHVIAKVIETLRSGLDNHALSADELRAQLATLRTKLVDNDAAADQALHDKFDGSTD